MAVSDAEDFTFANLPYGVAVGRADVAIGDQALDLLSAGFGDEFEGPRIGSWHVVRRRGEPTYVSVLGVLLHDERAARPHLVDRAALAMEVPVEIGDYVDGVRGASPCDEPRQDPAPRNGAAEPELAAPTRHVPRTHLDHRPFGDAHRDREDRCWSTTASSFVRRHSSTSSSSSARSSAVGNRHGQPIVVGDVPAHIFGYVLVNDWSARDIQAFEYQPLGPFLGKSFATSISPWVAPAAALQPYLVLGLAAEQEPKPPEYLQGDQRVPTFVSRSTSTTSE